MDKNKKGLEPSPFSMTLGVIIAVNVQAGPATSILKSFSRHSEHTGRIKLLFLQPSVIPITNRLIGLYALVTVLWMAGCTSAVCSGDCAPAEGWDNFANNLGSDLAPLLALFGEQVTKQYMSESLSWVDSLLFSLAPLGIITAMVAAIRVAGSPKLRSLIGRAKESRGQVEADLMSSTSSDVCELWNGEGVVRVLGRPVLLQIVRVESSPPGTDGNSPETDDFAGLYTFQDAIHRKIYSEKGTGSSSLESTNLDPGLEELRNRENPPNLTLNVSIRPLPAQVLLLFIIIGCLLQGGVVIFAAVAEYKLNLSKNNYPPVGSGFPLFLAGTIFLASGMFLCAQTVELSTEEKIYEPRDRTSATVIWLQQGGQTVGDQRFESFARRVKGIDIMTSHKSIKSERSHLVTIAIGTSFFGFVTQFVALREMHSAVTIAQLGAILIMTAIRSCAHIQRESDNDIKDPDQVEGHELDWLAKDLHGCKAWEVMSGQAIVDESEVAPDTLVATEPQVELGHGLLNYTKIHAAWKYITGQSKLEEPIPLLDYNNETPAQNLAMAVMKTRARLAALSKDWSLHDRAQIRNLRNAIEATINNVYSQMTLKDGWESEKEFRWELPVRARHGVTWQQSTVHLTIGRTQDQNEDWKPWKVKEGELEAVFCLWLSTLTEENRNRAKNGFAQFKHSRCVDLASDETVRNYRWWIFRETTPETSSRSHNTRYFGWRDQFMSVDLPEASDQLKYLCVEVESDFEKLCAQEVYAAFMFSIGKIISDVGGTTERRFTDSATGTTALSGDEFNNWMRYRLKNTNLDSLAACYHESNLGTIEEAYYAIIPALRAAEKVPSYHGVFQQACKASRRAEHIGNWTAAFELDKWVYLNCALTGLSAKWMMAEVEKRCLRLTIKLLKIIKNEKSAELWDAAYLACRDIQDSSPARTTGLLNLCTSRGRIRPSVDPQILFEATFQAAKALNGHRGYAPDILMKFMKFALQQDADAATEELAMSIWNATVSSRGGISVKRNSEIAQVLRTIRQRKGVFMHMDEFKPYLDNSGFIQRVAMITVGGERCRDTGDSLGPLDLDLIRNWRTPLQAAAGAGHCEVVQLLLDAKADVNARPAKDSGRTALQAAAEGNYPRIIEILLAATADINAKPAEYGGRTVLQAAAGAGHLEIVEQLLRANANVNSKQAQKNGLTALQAAAASGHLDIVERLLTVEADVNAKPAKEGGRTALQAAAESGHLDIVERLLTVEADVNAKPAWESGRTALQAAAESGHLDIVERLLTVEADVNAGPAKEGGRTALQAAAISGHLDIVERLLTVEADVNAGPGGEGGRTALQAAAESGHLDIVERLLTVEADVNAEPGWKGGRTALQAAAESGHLDIVERLLTVEADVNAKPAKEGGRTALQAAAESGHLDIVERLLTVEADVNAKPAKEGGRTALQAAATSGHLDIVERLLTVEADINAEPEGEGGRTALQAAAESGHLDIVERLLTVEADANAEPTWKGGRTALQAAAASGHLDIVERLLTVEADVNAEPGGEGGRTALQAAAESGHLDIVERLLIVEADVNAKPTWKGGRTALQAAAASGHLDIVERLLTVEADVNAGPGGGGGRTALQAAAESGHLDIVERLLTVEADVNAGPAKEGGRTALQAAAESGHLDIVERLLTVEADVNAKPAKEGGRTALQAAAASGHLGIVERLLTVEADINAEPGWGGGRTALQAAAESGHRDIVERLLKAGANVNAQLTEGYGRTALQAAAESGHLDIVERLLTVEADVNAEPGWAGGRTALQAAAESGHLDIVERLLKAGANVNAQPVQENGRTALQAAAESGHLDIVERLLQVGADVNEEQAENDGRTALQVAAESGDHDIVELLLEAGADVNAEPAKEWGRTALQAAAESSHLKIVKRLLEVGADVNAKPAEEFGQTALQAAAESGHLGIVETLLRAGADIHSTTRSGETALSMAEEYPKIQELLKNWEQSNPTHHRQFLGNPKYGKTT